MPSVDRLPLGANRWFPQRHMSFGRRTVCLTRIALHAGQHAILPRACSTPRTRLHVINRQLFRSRLRSAVLAREAVSFEDVTPTECDGVRGNAIVFCQRDHFRNADSKSHSLNEGLIVLWDQLGPIGPRVQLEVIRINDPSSFCSHQCQRPGNRSHSDRLPESIEYQGLSIEHHHDHVLHRQGIRGESNPPPRRSQRRVQHRYTTNTTTLNTLRTSLVPFQFAKFMSKAFLTCFRVCHCYIPAPTIGGLVTELHPFTMQRG